MTGFGMLLLEMQTKRYRQGEIRGDGMVFWSYNEDCKNGEYWITPERYQTRKEKRRIAQRRWVLQNPSSSKETLRRYKNKFPEKVAGWRKAWYAANRDKINAARREQVALRKKKDPVFSLASGFRSRVGLEFRKKNFTKRSSAFRILGCTFEQLQKHLEAQFLPGMTWKNRGEWHIDHIVPLATAKTEEDVVRLNHYTNLRPLWAIDNLKKGAKSA